MKRGFTILEMLVASLLLGMLMSVLTMIFNQSSIAWRTGMAGVSDLSTIEKNVAEVRYKADNTYVWNQAQCIYGVFDDTGNLRTGRGIGAFESAGSNNWTPPNEVSGESLNPTATGMGASQESASDNYTVNVKSAGPDRQFNTYDDIWSFPDEISFD